MHALFKRLVIAVCALLGPWAWRLRSRPRLLVIMYHRVLPRGHAALASEQPGMYVTPDSLRMHLDTLKRHFALVHLDDWLRAARQGERLPHNACALTFDDGWRDNFDFAWPVLREAAAPATIFLVSDFIGTAYRFWPNRLAALLAATPARDLERVLPPRLSSLFAAAGVFAGAGESALAEAASERAIAACKSLSDVDAEQLVSTLEAALPRTAGPAAERDLLDWSEIGQLADSGLIRFGSHTRHHCRLTEQIPAAILRDEIAVSGDTLARRLDRDVTMFCYPNGDHSPAAVSLVRDRYAAAVTTRRGWVEPQDDVYTLQRIGVHEDIAHEPRGFLARLTGWI